jgi:hypothetical protein
MQDLLWYHFTINLDLIGIFISKQIIDYPTATDHKYISMILLEFELDIIMYYFILSIVLA